MSLRIKERNDNQYLYFQEPEGENVYLGKLGETTNFSKRTIEAYNQINKKYSKYLEDSIRIISILPKSERKQYSSKLIKELEKQLNYISSLSGTKRQTNGDRTKVRQQFQEELINSLVEVITKSLQLKDIPEDLKPILIQNTMGYAMKSLNKKSLQHLKKEFKKKFENV